MSLAGTINLSKGGNASLGTLTKLTVGLGWDANDSKSGGAFDLDASIFILGDGEKLKRGQDFVFYNNQASPCGSVKHSGDNLSGDGDGDDETLNIDLSKLPPHAQKLVVCVTIHDAESRGQNFGQVSNSYVRLIDNATNNPVIRYDLQEDYSSCTAVVVGEIYKHNNQWKFRAVGRGYTGGLQGLVQKYG